MALGDGILGNVILGDTGSGGVASLDALLLFFSMGKISVGLILGTINVLFANSFVTVSFILGSPSVNFTIQEVTAGFTKAP
jgi:hypothetical protein